MSFWVLAAPAAVAPAGGGKSPAGLHPPCAPRIRRAAGCRRDRGRPSVRRLREKRHRRRIRRAELRGKGRVSFGQLFEHLQSSSVRSRKKDLKFTKICSDCLRHRRWARQAARHPPLAQLPARSAAHASRRKPAPPRRRCRRPPRPPAPAAAPMALHRSRPPPQQPMATAASPQRHQEKQEAGRRSAWAQRSPSHRPRLPP